MCEGRGFSLRERERVQSGEWNEERTVNTASAGGGGRGDYKEYG